MKTIRILFLLVGMLVNSSLYAQDFYSVGFVYDTISVSKSNEKEILTPLKIEIKLPDSDKYKDYSYTVSVVNNESTISKQDYTLIDFSKKITSKTEIENVFFLLAKDTLDDRKRKLSLEVKVFDGEKDVSSNNIAKNKKITLTINEHKTIEKNIKEYTVLSYVGTNFDLVDGIRAQNLFFATNIFLPPRLKKNKMGFYLSLYGNRAMSDIDSTGSVRRTYKLEKLTDSTYINNTEQSKMITNRVSDNIGAYISVLYPLFKNKDNNDLSLYYSPSLEFVWRRTSLIQEFSNPTNLESNIMTGYIPGTIEMGTVFRRQFNEYSFNAGVLGLFLTLENSDISVRIHASVGYSSNFYPKSLPNSSLIVTDRSHDIFFAGRTWITEPKTGLTLQAEITNTGINPRPFFGATLSKAFNLKELSGIFSPLTTRTK